MKKKTIVKTLDGKILELINSGDFNNAEKMVSMRSEFIKSNKSDFSLLEIIKIASSFGALLVILKYEQFDVVTSKAFGFLKGFRF